MYEQKYMNKYNLHPLKVVGLEGINGVVTLCVLLWPMYFITFDKTGIMKGIALGPEGRSEAQWRTESELFSLFSTLGLRMLLMPSR